MDIFTIYIALFFIVFLIMPVIYFTLRFILWFILEYCGYCHQNRERDRDHEQNTRRRSSHWGLFYDRQGNIFTISDETSGNPGANRYPDFFYLEPSSDEAARIRAQLEKDDKDLPSYDDVMRMTSLPATPMTPPPPLASAASTTVATPTTATSATIGNTTSATTISSSSSSLSPAPPPPDMTNPPSYSETPPSYEASSSSNMQPATTSTATASTSRGTAITIPITNSNTSV